MVLYFFIRKLFPIVLILIMGLTACSNAKMESNINYLSTDKQVEEINFFTKNSDSSNVTSEINMPFPKEQVTGSWRVGGKILVERTYDVNRNYYLIQDGHVYPIIGEASSSEYQRNENGKLYFIIHGGGTGVISFPETMWYDFSSGTIGREKAYLGLNDKCYWGGLGKDRLLKDLQISNNLIRFTFGVNKNTMLKEYSSPPIYQPFTKVSFDESTGELVFCFYQTETEEAPFRTIKALERKNIYGDFANISLEQLNEGLTPDAELPWWLHGIKPEEFVPFPAVLVRIKLNGDAKYTQAGDPIPNVYVDHSALADNADPQPTLTLEFRPK